MSALDSTLILLSLCYINEPVVIMRELPTEASTVVSQAVFAEQVKIEETQGDWSYIITPDSYKGWVKSENIKECPETYQPDLKVTRLKAHLYGIKDTEYGPIKTLPYGVELQKIYQEDERWILIKLPDGQKAYIQTGDVLAEEKLQHPSELVEFSARFLGLPYTWGGRTSFGYDCSGFIQMLYAKIGVQLERDSKHQILDERLSAVDFDQLQPGDLIFWGKAADKIRHVGLYVGEGRFIHSTARENKPWLRYSHLDDPEWTAEPHCFYPYRTARRLTR